MLGLGAFRRKPRQFEYKPLHYDPQMEAWEKRKRELLGDDEQHSEHKPEQEYSPGSYIRRQGFSRKKTAIAHPGSVSKEQRDRNIRRAVIALVLLFLILIYIVVT